MLDYQFFLQNDCKEVLEKYKIIFGKQTEDIAKKQEEVINTYLLEHIRK